MKNLTNFLLVLSLLQSTAALPGGEQPDPWGETPVATIPRALFHEDLMWVLESEAIPKLIPVEVKFRRPFFPLECRHLESRLKQISESQTWAALLDSDSVNYTSAIPPLLDLQWSQWSDMLQEPIADYEWRVPNPDPQQENFWEKSFQIILQDSHIESSENNFPIWNMNGAHSWVSNGERVLKGTLNRIDLCKNKHLNLITVDSCEIKTFKDLQRCKNNKIYRFTAPLAPNALDTELVSRLTPSSQNSGANLYQHQGAYRLHRCQVDLRIFPTCHNNLCEHKLMVYAEDRLQKKPGAVASFTLKEDELNISVNPNNPQAPKTKIFKRSWNINRTRYYQILSLQFDSKFRLQTLDMYEGRNSLPTYRKRTLCQN